MPIPSGYVILQHILFIRSGGTLNDRNEDRRTQMYDEQLITVNCPEEKIA